MRTLIVGDVHGCKDELEELVMERFGFVRGHDRLFQTGDMITRGPDSLGALELAESLGMRSVLGNQEARLLRVLGNAKRCDKDEAFLQRLEGHAEYIAKKVRHWPVWIEEDSFFLVHAGFQPGFSHPAYMDPHVLTHVRTWDGLGIDLENMENPPWFECGQWEKTIVFGHWAAMGLVVRRGLRGLDTGCATGGALTGWCPEENRLYQVAARREYARKTNQGIQRKCLQLASA